MFAVCWDFDEVAATKTADTCRDCPHAQRCWDFLPRLMPQGHEWSSNGPSEVPVKLTWLKFAGRVSSFYTIVSCWLLEMPRTATKEAMDPKQMVPNGTQVGGKMAFKYAQSTTNSVPEEEMHVARWPTHVVVVAWVGGQGRS